MDDALTNDPRFAATTIVVIDFEGLIPAGQPAEPIEVPALALHPLDGGLVELQRRQVPPWHGHLQQGYVLGRQGRFRRRQVLRRHGYLQRRGVLPGDSRLCQGDILWRGSQVHRCDGSRPRGLAGRSRVSRARWCHPCCGLVTAAR
ncbi:hypothetical protein [[Kitasatospora] papulosa]|uniref:hypothetical protein n=1 Tax=[Kitasatospora] papulosa TaxID=1464011 RepID=UPI0036B1A6BD